MKLEELKETLCEMSMEDVVVFESPDYAEACIGYTNDGYYDHAVYDYNKMVQCLMKEEGWTQEESIEWIDYNTIRALPYMGNNKPIIVYGFNK